MQISARSSSCVAILLIALAAPAAAQDRAIAAGALTVSVPKTTLVPDLASRAVVPTLTPAVFQIPAVAPTSAAPTVGVVTPAVAVVTPAIATVRPLDAPRVDLMPRTVVTTQPGVTSKLDVKATHEATRALTTKGEVAGKGQVGAGRDPATAEGGEDAKRDTKLAANSTGTATDAGSAGEPASSQARPMVRPTCR